MSGWTWRSLLGLESAERVMPVADTRPQCGFCLQHFDTDAQLEEHLSTEHHSGVGETRRLIQQSVTDQGTREWRLLVGGPEFFAVSGPREDQSMTKPEPFQYLPDGTPPPPYEQAPPAVGRAQPDPGQTSTRLSRLHDRESSDPLAQRPDCELCHGTGKQLTAPDLLELALQDLRDQGYSEATCLRLAAAAEAVLNERR